MNLPSLKIALVIFCAAVVAWVGVFLFLQAIHSGQTETAKAIAAARLANTSEDSRNQMLSVFSATESGRQAIKSMLSIDLLSLADTVIRAGSDAGVTLRVSNATPETQPVQKKGAVKPVAAVQFTIEAEGSFERLFNALALLEAMSIPSRVEEVSLSRLENDATSPWGMKVRLRILTNLPLSS